MLLRHSLLRFRFPQIRCKQKIGAHLKEARDPLEHEIGLLRMKL